MIPPAYRAHVIRRNGDVLSTVLVDGLVAGVWRPTEGGVEVTTFHDLTDDDWDGLEQEAAALRLLLIERDEAPYARYGHWWSKLPGVAVRVVVAPG